MSREKYIDKLPHLLMCYQQVEEILKVYISSADRLIHLNMKGKLYYSGLEVNNLMKFPLGKLIEQFKMRSGNEELIERLEKLPEKRNYFAHKGYLVNFEKEDCEFEELLQDLQESISETINCIKSILEETFKMRNMPVPEMLEEFEKYK